MKSMITALIIAAVLIICGIYIYFENNTLQSSKFDISSGRLPAAFDGFRIAQVSDFHNTGSSRLRNSIVSSLKAEKPDIIVLTGDFIDSRHTDVDGAMDFIQSIRDIAPIYFAAGNHESRLEEYLQIKKRLAENGVAVLDNKTVLLEKDGCFINLIGIDDPAMAHRKDISPDVIAAQELDAAGADMSKYTVLLSHRPELFETYAAKKVDLVLSGHAHGGLVRLPFIGGIIAPGQGLFPQYTAGTFEKGQTVMAVSRGLGSSVLPVRLRINNRPELVFIVLKHA